MRGVIAIVGRPNVGKSALFNRIAGRRIAIVHDEPGVTRDRITAEVEWRGIHFTIIDTGGIGLLPGEKTDDQILKAAIEQVNLAIESSHLIFLVVDAKDGLTPLDSEIGKLLHQKGKTVFVVVNKVDNIKENLNILEFSKLGFEQIFPVSAIHGSGVDNLIKAAIKELPEPETLEREREETEETQQPPTKLAIVGKPNVGKSSIINALTKSSRVIVSDIPGTTRDSVDVPFEIETNGQRQRYILIDTAGIRKRKSISTSIEFFSVKRAEDAIIRSDIVIFVIDADAGITEQDKKIADLITENHKPCILVVNKWDLFQETVEKAYKEKIKKSKKKTEEILPDPVIEFQKWIHEKMFFLSYAPVLFTSATSGLNLDRLLEAIRYVESQLQQKVPTAILNRVLHDAVERKQPVSSKGHFLKFFYATQIKLAPPTFLLFVNRKELFSPQYEKYIAGEIRKAFGYEGCPIVLIPRPRPKKEEMHERH